MMKTLFVFLSLQRFYSVNGYNPKPAGILRAGLGPVFLRFVNTDIIIAVEKHVRNGQAGLETPGVPATRSGQGRSHPGASPDPGGW